MAWTFLAPTVYERCSRKAVHAELVTGSGSKPGNKNHKENWFFGRAECPIIHLLHHWPVTVFGNKGDPSFLLSLFHTKAVAVLLLLLALCQLIFQVTLGNFSEVHHGPGKKPLTHPHCWTWAQPLGAPNPHNLHLNSLLLLSLHFRSLLCQTKTGAGGQLGAGSPWADGIYSHPFLLLEAWGVAQLFRNSWPTLHLIKGMKVSATDFPFREAGNPHSVSSLKSSPSF